MSDSLRDVLPAIYRPLWPDFFDRPAIVESRATCADCAMCDKGAALAEASPSLDVALFRPDIKCCSYHPTLPNYLAGAVLDDGSAELAEGRARLERKIDARVGVTPRWLAAPRKYLVLLAAARESSFGRSESLLCPYYERDGGTCTIWRHRESVCATFFCKHVAGAAGHAFWAALRRYLEHVELALARYAHEQVDGALVEPDLPRNVLTREDLEDRPPRDDEYARWWGPWAGREAAFYVACSRAVRALTAAEFAAIVDAHAGRELLTKANEAYEAVTKPQLVARLRLNPDMRVLPAAGGVGVTTYSRYDSLFLTQDLYDAISLFASGESVDAVIERLKREHDVELPRELLLELQLHGVVTPAG